jgi:hypothetical protein
MGLELPLRDGFTAWLFNSPGIPSAAITSVKWPSESIAAHGVHVLTRQQLLAGSLALPCLEVKLRISVSLRGADGPQGSGIQGKSQNGFGLNGGSILHDRLDGVITGGV